MRRNTGGSWVISGTHITNTGSNSSVVIARSGLSTLQGEYGIGGDQSVNPLPIKLTAFEANKVANDVKLAWSTASEFNNKGFDVERSFDGKQFDPVGFVEGNGSTSSISNYSYTDIGAASLTDHQLYYRLKQLDFNGDYTYSNVVSVSMNHTAQNTFRVYPNPANTTFTVEGSSEPVILYDMTGNKVLTINANGLADLSSLKDGVYFIRSGSHTQKLVKK